MSEWVPLPDGFLMQFPSFVVLAPPFIFHPETHKINFDEPNNYVVSKTEFGPAILVFTDRDLAKKFVIAADMAGSVLITSIADVSALGRLVCGVVRHGGPPPNILLDMSKGFAGRVVSYEEILRHAMVKVKLQ